MNKHILSILSVFLFFTVSLSAQIAEPHYVVIADADAEIERLQAENEEMVHTSDSLEQQNSQLDDEIAESQDFIVKADDMIEKIVAARGPVWTALQTVNDPETRRDLIQKMEDLRQSQYDLENYKRREYEAISKANGQIDTNRKMIAVNRVRTNSNDQRIQYLGSCRAYTLNENRDVDSVLDNADQVRREVEQLLNR